MPVILMGNFGGACQAREIEGPGCLIPFYTLYNLLLIPFITFYRGKEALSCASSIPVVPSCF